MAESRKDFSNFVRHHSRRLTNIKNGGTPVLSKAIKRGGLAAIYEMKKLGLDRLPFLPRVV